MFSYRKKVLKLENWFVKHYAHKHTLSFKHDMTVTLNHHKRANLQRPIARDVFFRIYSKVNQVIFLSLPIYASSNEALAPTVFEIFC